MGEKRDQQFVTVEFLQRVMREMEERLLRSVQSMLSCITLPPAQQNVTIEVKTRKKVKKGKKPKRAGGEPEPPPKPSRSQ